jgi:hypothetical protein
LTSLPETLIEEEIKMIDIVVFEQWLLFTKYLL